MLTKCIECAESAVVRFLFTNHLSWKTHYVAGDLNPHMNSPFVSGDPVTLASANQPTTTYSNLQALKTLAPVAAGDSRSADASSPVGKITAPSAPPVTIDGCSQTKGCLATPAGCSVSGQTCQAILSYMADPDRTGQIKFELWRKMTEQKDQYVAAGFGPLSSRMVSSTVVRIRAK